MKTKLYKCSSFCSFYKGEKFIQGYINDVLKQRMFNDIEFIFLDCASPENEKKYIIPLTEKYENIKYIKFESDPGLYAAWNIAVSLCSSNIIGNWNIDDRKSVYGFEPLIKAFDKDPELDIVYGFTYVSKIANEQYEDNSYELIYPYLPHSPINLIQNNSPHCMPLWKKNIHDRFGYFNESYETAADGDMWLRACVGGAKIKHINHPVGLYYENPTGRSSNPATLEKMISEVVAMRKLYVDKIKKMSTQ